MDGNDLTKRPEENELEISIFGPGYGECVLLHTGQNNWIVVDSCVFPGDNQPAPLHYFDQMGLKYDAIKAIVATHWHDDHIKGLSNIFSSCSNAEFICSAALHNKEFLELVEIYGNCVISGDSGIKEFHEILNEMLERSQKNKTNYTPKFAIADRHIWKNIFKDKSGKTVTANLYALSPGDSAIVSTKLDIIKYMPSQNKYPRPIPAITPNHASVVLWFSFNDINILLGSDLEEKDNPNKGWSVIIESKTRPDGKASLYKVAHHGSINAYHPQIWKELLTDSPIAVLTPFSKGKKLPAIEGIKKICSRTTNAFITGNPFSKKKFIRNRVVEKTINETTGKINMMSPSYGHIRIRMKSKQEYSSIELFGSAQKLCTNR